MSWRRGLPAAICFAAELSGREGGMAVCVREKSCCSPGSNSVIYCPDSQGCLPGIKLPYFRWPRSKAAD